MTSAIKAALLLFTAAVAIAIWATMFILCVWSFSTFANATANPEHQALITRPQTPVERDLPKARCFRLKTAIVVVEMADGRVMIVPVQRVVAC